MPKKNPKNLNSQSVTHAAIRSGFEQEMARLTNGGDKPPIDAISLGRGGDRDRLYAVTDNLAIIPVQGVLVQSTDYISRYVTGYNIIRLMFERALNDDDVRGVVLDIRSPGGVVAGCFDLVDWMRQSATESGKNVVAICSEVAYSAAYAIASVADIISVPRTGGVGSIGTAMIHMEMSGALDDYGISVTVLRSGKLKLRGNVFEKLDKSVKSDWQEELDATRLLFAETVSRNRITANRPIDVDQILETEARVYEGPVAVVEAQNLGLVDVVAAPDVVFAEMAKQINA